MYEGAGWQGLVGPSGHKVNPGSGRKRSGSSRMRPGTSRVRSLRYFRCRMGKKKKNLGISSMWGRKVKG